MRAIDADHLRRWILSRVFKTQLSVADVIDQIDREDTIEPERKKGMWIKHIDDLFPAESTLECNMCHHEQPITIDDNYCPNCGTEMREDGESDESD